MTPTRMSVPHPVDGSIHPVPVREVGKRRRHTITPTRISVPHELDGSMHPLPIAEVGVLLVCIEA